jgi:hypothetical protein
VWCNRAGRVSLVLALLAEGLSELDSPRARETALLVLSSNPDPSACLVRVGRLRGQRGRRGIQYLRDGILPGDGSKASRRCGCLITLSYQKWLNNLGKDLLGLNPDLWLLVRPKPWRKRETLHFASTRFCRNCGVWSGLASFLLHHKLNNCLNQSEPMGRFEIS